MIVSSYFLCNQLTFSVQLSFLLILCTEQSLLQIAMAEGNASTESSITDLLQKGASPDACCSDIGGLALHETTKNDNNIAARMLIAAGASIESKDRIFGNTPLHDAAKNNAPRVAKLLLENGASVDEQNNKQQAPLHLSAINGTADVARHLLNNGGNVTAVDEQGNTPLHVIADVNPGSFARLLIRNGAVVDLKNRNGEAPLHLAVTRATARGLVQVLIGADANIDARNHEDQTPLHVSTAAGVPEVVAQLLAAGANTSAEDAEQQIPADLICQAPSAACSREDQMRLVKSLLKVRHFLFLRSGETGTEDGIHGTGSGQWRCESMLCKLSSKIWNRESMLVAIDNTSTKWFEWLISLCWLVAFFDTSSVSVLMLWMHIC